MKKVGRSVSLEPQRSAPKHHGLFSRHFHHSKEEGKTPLPIAVPDESVVEEKTGDDLTNEDIQEPMIGSLRESSGLCELPSCPVRTQSTPTVAIAGSPVSPPVRKTVFVQGLDGKRISLNKNNSKKIKFYDGLKQIVECRDRAEDVLDISTSSLDRVSSAIGTLTNLTRLFLYENKLTFLPAEIGGLVNLQQLWVQENWLTQLPEELGQCQNLTHLDLRHNRLEGVLPRVLLRLTKLQQLLLTYNKLNDIDCIGQLTNLQMLVLKSNQLRGHVPTSIGFLTNLNCLDLSKNKLTHLPEEIGNCVQLTRLMLEYNQFVQLPDSIERLTNLRILGIKYNRLVTLPATLVSCQLLTELNIENNQVSALPADLLSKMPKVTTVVLSRNSFATFPPGGPNQFTATERLNLDYNNLDRIPMGIFSSSKSLTVLNLCYNNIISLIPEDVATWTTLVELHLAYNQLSVVPEEIGQLRQLEVLDLTNNKIKKIPGTIGQLSNLRTFEMEFNQVELIPPEIGELTELRTLNLSSNTITTVPKTFGNLQNLTILKLSDNMITKLPREIGRLHCLTHLFLKDNPTLNSLPLDIATMRKLTFLSLEGCGLRDLPPEYVAGGPVAIIAYFRAIKAGLRLQDYLQHGFPNGPHHAQQTASAVAAGAAAGVKTHLGHQSPPITRIASKSSTPAPAAAQRH